MLEAFLVPPKTRVSSKGDSAALDLSGAAHRVLLVVLRITDAVEQESLDLTLWGSADGAAWTAKPVAVFPQKFYVGETPMLLDLTDLPDVKHLRAHWEVSRWGRGDVTPMFEFQVAMREVPAEMLREGRPAVVSS